MAMKLDIVDLDGNVKGGLEIEDRYLELEKGAQLVHDAVVAHLAGVRAGTASTKIKSEVSGGGAKPWRQKGTGRARAGSNRSPLWRHGGVTFGPKPRSYAKKLNRKMLAMALRRAFSERVKEGAVAVLESAVLPDHKTKTLAGALKKLNATSNTLMLVQAPDENLARASGNLQGFEVAKAANVNTYQMLLHERILIAKDAVDVFLKRIEKGA